MCRFMVEDLDIVGVDVGEGKDKGVQCWIRIGDDGKYIPVTVIDTTTTISLADSVQRSGYVGVEAGELTFSAEIVDVDDYALRGLFDLSKEMELLGVSIKKLLDSKIAYWDLMVSLCNQVKGSKRRKTTYKTIRRDCAKRNRHK